MRFLAMFLNTFVVMPFMLFSTVKGCTLVDIQIKNEETGGFDGWTKEPNMMFVDTVNLDSIEVININNPVGVISLGKAGEGPVTITYKIYTKDNRFYDPNRMERIYEGRSITIDVRRGKGVKVDMEMGLPTTPKLVDVAGINIKVKVGCKVDTLLVNGVNGYVDCHGDIGHLRLNLVNGVVKPNGFYNSVRINLVNGKVKGSIGVKDSLRIEMVNGKVDLDVMGEHYSLTMNTNRGRIALEGFEDLNTRRVSTTDVEALMGNGVVPFEIEMKNGNITLRRAR